MRSDAQGEIRALTGLRGIAACLVVCFHLFALDVPQPALRAILWHGYIWVDAFFVLSGFVMALSFPLPAGPLLGKRFLIFLGRRIARIWPLYAVSSVAGLLIIETGHSFYPFYHYDGPKTLLLTNLLMVQNWGWLAPGAPHEWARSLDAAGWSLSTEWTAYLFYPLLFTLVFLRRRTAVVAFGLAAASLAWIGLTQWPDMPWRHGPLDLTDGDRVQGLLRCIAEFTLGLLAYRVKDHPLARAVLRNRVASGVLLVAILTLLAWPWTDLLVVPLFAALIIALLEPRAPAARLLGWGVLYQLGVWSYAIYLVHTPYLISVLHLWVNLRWSGKLAQALAGLGVIFPLAVVLHYAVERPGRRWVRRAVDATFGR